MEDPTDVERTQCESDEAQTKRHVESAATRKKESRTKVVYDKRLRPLYKKIMAEAKKLSPRAITILLVTTPVAEWKTAKGEKAVFTSAMVCVDGDKRGVQQTLKQTLRKLQEAEMEEMMEHIRKTMMGPNGMGKLIAEAKEKGLVPPCFGHRHDKKGRGR